MDSDRLQATPDIRKRLIGETKRLQRLVNNLQDLSKAESGSLPLSLQALRLPPLLAELTERFESQLMDEGPTLRLVCPADLPKVWADSDRVEQILINLLGNAIRHTQQGSITLKAWSTSDQVWMAVTDTGCGLSLGELPHVFERFWRSGKADRSTAAAPALASLLPAARRVTGRHKSLSKASLIGERPFNFGCQKQPINSANSAGFSFPINLLSLNNFLSVYLYVCLYTDGAIRSQNVLLCLQY